MKIKGFIKRMISIDVRSEQELVELMERITERINYINFRAQSSPKRLKLFFYGPKDMVKAAIAEVYEISRSVKGILYPDARGLYSYSVREIMNLVRGAAIPLNLLIYALRFKGFEAMLEGGSIRTNARLEEVAEIASIISDAYDEMKYIRMTPMCKRLVAIYVAVKDVSVHEAIADLEEITLIKKVKEESPYTLAMEFNQALSKLEHHLRREKLEGESN